MMRKPINGFEGLYEIDEDGGVYSLRSKKYLKPIKTNSGYLQVSLFVNSKRFYRYIHRLVAEAFIDNPNNLLEINHIDENKMNNNVNNLEWCSHKYNCNYGNRNANVSSSIGQYDLDGNLIKAFKSIKEASAETGIKVANISAVASKHKWRKTAGGFVWRYL